MNAIAIFVIFVGLMVLPAIYVLKLTITLAAFRKDKVAGSSKGVYRSIFQVMDHDNYSTEGQPILSRLKVAYLIYLISFSAGAIIIGRILYVSSLLSG